MTDILISEHYKEMNRQMHAAREDGKNDFGSHGDDWAPQVEKCAALIGSTNILDYGCGDGALARALPELPLYEYDPGIRGKDDEPQPADMVVCIDVLEHVEPECLTAVLDHLQLLTKRLAFIVIDTKPAQKTLPDGRNAHLSVQPVQWWVDEINRRFVLAQFQFVNRRVLLFIAHSHAEAERSNYAKPAA